MKGGVRVCVMARSAGESLVPGRSRRAGTGARGSGRRCKGAVLIAKGKQQGSVAGGPDM